MQPDFSYAPLSPADFLHRTAHVFPDRIGIVDGDVRFTWRAFHERCLRFAGALRALGVQPGDRVAVLAGNSHVLLAAHYAVPFAGAVLVALNTRITPADVAFILDHAGAAVLIFDDAYAAQAMQAAAGRDAALRLVRAGGADDEIELLIAEATPFL